MSRTKPVCSKCASENVRWAQNDAGKWYLQNITNISRYDNGTQYSRGPHFKTCAAQRAAFIASIRQTQLEIEKETGEKITRSSDEEEIAKHVSALKKMINQ